jgi:hypothetical protein
MTGVVAARRAVGTRIGQCLSVGSDDAREFAPIVDMVQ